MCKCNSESVEHLFLYCPVASELWDMVFGLFGVCWVMPMCPVASELWDMVFGLFGVCWVMPMSVVGLLLAGKVVLVAIVMEIFGRLFLFV